MTTPTMKYVILVKQYGKIHLRIPTDKTNTDHYADSSEAEARDKMICDKAKECKTMENGYFDCQVIDPSNGAEFDHWILIR